MTQESFPMCTRWRRPLAEPHFKPGAGILLMACQLSARPEAVALLPTLYNRLFERTKSLILAVKPKHLRKAPTNAVEMT